MEQYVLNQEDYTKLKDESLVIKYMIENDSFEIDGNNIYINKLSKYLKNYIISQKYIIFVFDFSSLPLNLNQADNIVCNIKKLENIKSIKEIKKYVYMISSNSNYENFISASVCVLNAENRKEKYNYLYDSICEYLDNRVVKSNVCGFEHDKCIVKRNTSCTMGCCHHYKNKLFGMFYEKELKLCEFQKEKRCTAKCISCKMFMCDTLKKKGYNFTTRNVITIKRYFDPIQKMIIVTSFFTPKEKIMKRLLLF